jgi:hypothetical protein
MTTKASAYPCSAVPAYRSVVEDRLSRTLVSLFAKFKIDFREDKSLNMQTRVKVPKDFSRGKFDTSFHRISQITNLSIDA